MAEKRPGCGAVHANERPVCRFGGPTVLKAKAVPTGQDGATPAASDESGARLYRAPPSSGGGTSAQDGSGLFGTATPTEQWLYVLQGACVRYAFVLPKVHAQVLQRQIRAGVPFVTRRALDQVMRERTGRDLDVPGVSR